MIKRMRIIRGEFSDAWFARPGSCPWPSSPTQTWLGVQLAAETNKTDTHSTASLSEKAKQEGVAVTFWAVTEKAEEVVVSSCVLMSQSTPRLLVKAKCK